jgi:hypothetical protein
MKLLLPAALLLIGLAGCNGCPEPVQLADKSASPSQRELVRVQGSAVNFNILTFRAISCSAYGRQFARATPIDITDRVTLTRISQRLKRLQTSSPGHRINIRAKAILV